MVYVRLLLGQFTTLELPERRGVFLLSSLTFRGFVLRGFENSLRTLKNKNTAFGPSVESTMTSAGQLDEIFEPCGVVLRETK